MKKSKNKLMQVGNTREYQAMLREMDSMEKLNRNRREEEAALFEELQIQQDKLSEIDKEYESLQSEVEKRKTTLDATLEEGKAELEKLNKKREIFSQSIDKPVFQRYEFIRRRLEHPVIVDVDAGVCSGCHIAIPPQTFIELQTGQQILSCPNCQRLIFWSQHFEAAPEIGKIIEESSEIGEEAAEETAE